MPPIIVSCFRTHRVGGFLVALSLLGCAVGIAATFYTQQVIAVLSRLSTDGLDANVKYSLSRLGESLLILSACVFLLGLTAIILGKSRITRIIDAFSALNPLAFCLIILALSVFLNLLLLLLIPYKPWADFAWYHEQAINLIQGRGVISNGKPTAFWPVGYSLFLAPFYAVFGPSLTVAQLLNVALRSALALLTYMTGREVFGEIVGRRSLVVIAFFPSLLFYTLVTNSDLLFASLFALAAWLLIRLSPRPKVGVTIFIGLVLGIAGYVRPIILLFPLLVMFWIGLNTQKLKAALLHSGLIVALMTIVLSPWVYRNYQTFGKLILVSTNGGYNLYVGNNPNASGGYNVLPQINSQDLDEPSRDEALRTQAISFILQHPGQFLANMLKKAIHLYVRDDQGISFATKQTFNSLPANVLGSFFVLSDSYYLVVFVSAAVYLIVRLKEWSTNRNALLLVAMFLYVTSIYLVFFGADRFHVPVIFILCIFMGSLMSCKSDTRMIKLRHVYS
jgi:4-amino-4-deoxy-L-arabinose transferase-like glycosyltransferase